MWLIALHGCVARARPFLLFGLTDCRRGGDCDNYRARTRDAPPGSRAPCLPGVAGGKTCLLVVDQMGAISIASGRRPEMWTWFDELRREAERFPNMSLIGGCREFDLAVRFLLLYEALESNRQELAFPAFERLFTNAACPAIFEAIKMQSRKAASSIESLCTGGMTTIASNLGFV